MNTTKLVLAVGAMLVLIGLLMPNTVLADQIIFSNLGPGGTYLAAESFDPVGTQALAMPFTVASGPGFALTQIDVALTNPFFGSGLTAGAVVELLNDSGSGTPGTSILGTWNLTNLPSFPVSSIQSGQTISGITGITLNGGVTYWLAALAPSNDGWNLATTALGAYAFSSDSGTTWISSNGNVAAFDALGTPVAATAEPSTMLLLGSGVLGLMAMIRSRKRLI